MRTVMVVVVLAGAWAGATSADPKPAAGDAVIRGKAGSSEIVVTTTARLAGAIHSVTWNGKEFIDSTDHGRQLQSAASFATDLTNYGPETFNPTEAGSVRDGAGPASTSRLLSIGAAGNRLVTEVRPAFWLPPGGRDAEGRPARNTAALSDHRIRKEVVIGYQRFGHALDYRVTFTVPPGERHTYAQFEAVTGYMPAEFSKFWTVDVTKPAAGRVRPLSDGPGEQGLPVALSTPDEKYAMGVWSPDQPSEGYEAAGYGRFRFTAENVVKWNCVFRVHDRGGIKPGDYSYRMFVAVGSLADVRDTLVGVSQEFKE